MRAARHVRKFWVAMCTAVGLAVLAACSSSSGLPSPASIAVAAQAAAAQPANSATAAAEATGDGDAAAGGATSDLAVVNDKGRFVNMALDPATGKGVDIDIYLA